MLGNQGPQALGVLVPPAWTPLSRLCSSAKRQQRLQLSAKQRQPLSEGCQRCNYPHQLVVVCESGPSLQNLPLKTLLTISEADASDRRASPAAASSPCCSSNDGTAGTSELAEIRSTAARACHVVTKHAAHEAGLRGYRRQRGRIPGLHAGCRFHGSLLVPGALVLVLVHVRVILLPLRAPGRRRRPSLVCQSSAPSEFAATTRASAVRNSAQSRKDRRQRAWPQP